jgi:hypothetical protein
MELLLNDLHFVMVVYAHKLRMELIDVVVFYLSMAVYINLPILDDQIFDKENKMFV